MNPILISGVGIKPAFFQNPGHYKRTLLSIASIYAIRLLEVPPGGDALLATPEDRDYFYALLRSSRWNTVLPVSPGELVLAVGKHFIGRPFAARTLEQDEGEKLVINLRQLDCFTFVENTVVLAGMIRAGKTSVADFTDALRTARYRKGLLAGYSSRLHYFSDWLDDNRGKGVIRDITSEIGGERFDKKINFMTTNVDKYPPLKSPGIYRRMLAVEQTCSQRTLYHVPKVKLRECEQQIQNGDLIAITTNLEGLDVIHVGFGIKIKRGLHLLHASQQAGQVIISRETIYRYLQSRKSRLGIMVARVL
jgi:hypothetical protein